METDGKHLLDSPNGRGLPLFQTHSFRMLRAPWGRFRTLLDGDELPGSEGFLLTETQSAV